MKPCVCVVFLLAVVIISGSTMHRAFGGAAPAAECDPMALSPYTTAMLGSAAPSEERCKKLREQKPCLCRYRKDPKLRHYIDYRNSKKDVHAEDITAMNSESGVRIKTAVGWGDIYVRGMNLNTMKWIFWMTGNYNSHAEEAAAAQGGGGLRRRWRTAEEAHGGGGPRRRRRTGGSLSPAAVQRFVRWGVRVVRRRPSDLCTGACELSGGATV